MSGLGLRLRVGAAVALCAAMLCLAVAPRSAFAYDWCSDSSGGDTCPEFAAVYPYYMLLDRFCAVRGGYRTPCVVSSSASASSGYRFDNYHVVPPSFESDDIALFLKPGFASVVQSAIDGGHDVVLAVQVITSGAMTFVYSYPRGALAVSVEGGALSFANVSDDDVELLRYSSGNPNLCHSDEIGWYVYHYPDSSSSWGTSVAAGDIFKGPPVNRYAIVSAPDQGPDPVDPDPPSPAVAVLTETLSDVADAGREGVLGAMPAVAAVSAVGVLVTLGVRWVRRIGL